jgi:hypothetical protein
LSVVAVEVAQGMNRECMPGEGGDERLYSNAIMMVVGRLKKAGIDDSEFIGAESMDSCSTFQALSNAILVDVPQLRAKVP